MEEVYNSDVPDYIIGKFYSTFHFIGVWRIETRAHFHQLISPIYFMVFSLSIFVKTCMTGEQDEFVFLIVISLMCIVQTRRICMLAWRKDEIFSLTQMLLCVRHTNDYEFYVKVNRKIKLMTTLVKSFILIMLLALLTAIVAPIFVKQLVFDIYFPGDYKTSRLAFWLAYAFMVGGITLSVVCCFVNIIAWFVMLNIVIQIEILNNRFQNLGVCKLRDENGLKIHLSMREQQKLYEKQFAEAIETNLEIHEY